MGDGEGESGSVDLHTNLAESPRWKEVAAMLGMVVTVAAIYGIVGLLSILEKAWNTLDPRSSE